MFIPTIGGRRGHPVLFRSTARDSILALPDGAGLNSWREANLDQVELVPVQTQEILRDIDTRADYEAAMRRSNET
jgi:CTP:molybdopterin cytidylyltransferase MocA